jgi:hypothetical protein
MPTDMTAYAQLLLALFCIILVGVTVYTAHRDYKEIERATKELESFYRKLKDKN